jgi:AcrR family transcriptional regulator
MSRRHRAMCGIGRPRFTSTSRTRTIFPTPKHSFDLLQPDFRQILEQPGLTSLERIAAILRAILTLFYQDKRALLVLVEHSLRLLRENREVAGRLRDRMRGLQDLLESLLREGVAAGQIRPLGARGQAQALTMLAESSILQFSMNPEVPLEEVIAGVENLLQGLRA